MGGLGRTVVAPPAGAPHGRRRVGHPPPLDRGPSGGPVVGKVPIDRFCLWAAIPGAKGCTAEACSFRDLRDDFAVLGWEVIGCSVQNTAYQSEAASRLHLPYPIVSDQDFALRGTLGLSTFEFEGDELYRRITLLVDGGIVVAVIEPGQDPGSHVEDVLKVVRQIGSGA
ncbi:peroxiredoxin [Arthrobacter sp. 2RAF6]|uniref:peroxiredoxin n=1 Tax=Arthrobacter sp. 2RAF6 TaxID=3233002 RepID=UPI003F8E95E5